MSSRPSFYDTDEWIEFDETLRAAAERRGVEVVSADEANLIHATQGAVRGANFEQPVTVAAWTTKPSWYIVAANDRMIDPGAQRALAKKIGATTVELPTSHVPMASSPDEVAKVIIEAARTAAK